jgi:hypothetical protein
MPVNTGPRIGTSKRSDFTINKLMTHVPGPANYRLSDLEPAEKWNYKTSKAYIIGKHPKEFDKDKQMFSNLLHLNKGRDCPGPGAYNNEVEPLSPKKVRDNMISDKRKRFMSL